jgi:hypothetical protein
MDEFLSQIHRKSTVSRSWVQSLIVPPLDWNDQADAIPLAVATNQKHIRW